MALVRPLLPPPAVLAVGQLGRCRGADLLLLLLLLLQSRARASGDKSGCV